MTLNTVNEKKGWTEVRHMSLRFEQHLESNWADKNRSDFFQKITQLHIRLPSNSNNAKNRTDKS